MTPEEVQAIEVRVMKCKLLGHHVEWQRVTYMAPKTTERWLVCMGCDDVILEAFPESSEDFGVEEGESITV